METISSITGLDFYKVLEMDDAFAMKILLMKQESNNFEKNFYKLKSKTK